MTEVTELKEEKNLDKLTLPEMKREIKDLLQQIEMKDKEISRLKAMVKKMMSEEAAKEEIIDIRKRANEVLKSSLAHADEIIKEARITAGKIIERANALKASVEKGETEPEFVLPGSKELVIGDDILKAGSSRGTEQVPQRKSGSIFDEYFGGKKEEEASDEWVTGGGWRELLDSLHKK